eukprot:31031-Prymnesium_polylepis.1
MSSAPLILLCRTCSVFSRLHVSLEQSDANISLIGFSSKCGEAGRGRRGHFFMREATARGRWRELRGEHVERALPSGVRRRPGGGGGRAQRRRPGRARPRARCRNVVPT